MPVTEICRTGGFSDTTFYKWRSKFGVMKASDAQRLRELEVENGRLKKLPVPVVLVAGRPHSRRSVVEGLRR
jgi:transposase-like protein